MADIARRHKRKFVGQAGRIVAWGRPGMDCVIANASQGGARLIVAGADAVPDIFVLVIAGAVRRRCKVVWRTPTRLGVSFLAPERQAPAAAADARPAGGERQAPVAAADAEPVAAESRFTKDFFSNV